jgi:transportin-3
MADGANAAGGFGPVLSALKTMQSNVGGEEKSSAHEYLEKFQKSVRQNLVTFQVQELIRPQSEAWNTTHAILQDQSAPQEARLFAATTLKGKVCRLHLDSHTAY